MASNLPSEILTMIFTECRESYGLKRLRNSLRVSRSWNAAAAPVFYANVFLRNRDDRGSLFDFLKIAQRNPHLCFVRSLSVRIYPYILRARAFEENGSHMDLWSRNENCEHMESEKLVSALQALTDIIDQKITHLRTFSLFIELPMRPSFTKDEPPPSYEHRVMNAFCMPPSFIGRIVKALPPSCTNLEIDTNGTDLSYCVHGLERGKDSGRHLCDDIRNVLPRMEHVNLRLGTVCSMLVKEDTSGFVTAPHLQSLTVSFIPRGAHFKYRLVSETVCSLSECEDPPRGPGPFSDARFWVWEDGVPPVPKLVKNLSLASQEGCFPRAHTIQITQYENDLARISDRSPDWHNDPDVLEDGTFVALQDWILTYTFYAERILLRDCLHDASYALPWPDLERWSSCNPTIIYDKNDHAHIGYRDDTLVVGEGHVWEEVAAYGARLPREFTSDIRFLVRPLKSREEYQQIPGGTIPRKGGWKTDPHHSLPRVVKLESADATVVMEDLPMLGD